MTNIPHSLPCPKCGNTAWANQIYRTIWIDCRGSKLAMNSPTGQYTPNYYCGKCKEYVIGGRPPDTWTEEERREAIENITHNLQRCYEATEAHDLCEDIEKAINNE